MSNELTEKEIKKLRHLLIQEHMVFVLEGVQLLESYMDGMPLEQFQTVIQRVTKKRRALEVEDISFKKQRNVFIGFPHRNYLGLWMLGMLAGCSEMKEQGAMITRLSLTGCKLEAIPISIASCKNLEHLDLSFNRLTELPEVIRTFMNLKKLYVDNNRLLMLPEWIGEMEQLRILDISCNLIEELPEEFSKLVHLRELFMAQTRITELPDWLVHFEDIHWLSVKKNALDGVQLEKLGRFFPHKNIEF